MKTITFSAIKGGVGKSSLCLLTANTLNDLGFKVLVIDMDIQNSATFYYAPDQEEIEDKNIARVLNDNKVKNNIIKNENKSDLIPSSFNLIKLRTIPIKTLSRIMDQINDLYDFCLIDTAPTFDNIVLNAINASDLIITPVRLSQFDWKSAKFYKEQLTLETDKTSNWKVLFNFYKEPRSSNPDTELNQYIKLFEDEFKEHILKTKIPETVLIQKAIDLGIKIKPSGKMIKLNKAIYSLSSELTEITITEKENNK